MFSRPGTAARADRSVSDVEHRFDLAPPNLEPGQ
jgi:hypothetical protein